MEGSDHDMFILHDSFSSASSLNFPRANVLPAAVEMCPRRTFPLPSSGHDSLCIIDSDTIIMTHNQLRNHSGKILREHKTSAPIEAYLTTM